MFVIEGSAVVHYLRNVFIVRVDHLLEWDATTFMSHLPIANPNGGDVSQMVNDYTAFNDRHMMFS